VTDYASLLGDFPRERAWLLPALQAVQHHHRWLPPEALIAVSEHLRVPRSEVYGVATSYPELRLAAPGRRVVRVCIGVSCRVRGSLGLLSALEREAGIAADHTAADGSLTLERLDCAFNCSVAPVVEVDGRYAGRVALRDTVTLLRGPAPAVVPEDRRAKAPAGSAVPAPLAAGPAPRKEDDALAQFAELERAARAARPAAGLRLLVAMGSCSLAVGAAETLAALRQEISRRALDIAIGTTGCSGACWAAPALAVSSGEGPARFLEGITADRVADVVEVAAGGRLPPGDANLEGFLTGQRRELTARCGVVDPNDIADAIGRGSYAALARALAEGRPERVIAEVKAARLLGRGGAYFPAAVKWEGARAAPGAMKYLVVNGEEGEPGIFKDRHLMEGDPHRLIEGALLAAYAAGATRVLFYVHGEANLSAARLAHAVADAQRWGFVGERVLGTDFSVEVELRRGAGGFVLGEETALMESIEGRRAMPRAKPPFPVEAGLWGRPTVINNVETLFAVPLIAGRGSAWWSTLGQGHGTKCFGLSGQVIRPGVVEMELGATLRDLVSGLGGGVPGGEPLKAVVLGGPSGVVVPPRDLDEPLLPGGSVNPGTGGTAVLGASASVRDVAHVLLDFNTRESCGKCTPCREGTARLRDVLDGLAPSPPGGVAELSEVVRLASLCGLGQAAPLSLLSALREFPDELALTPGRVS
jgi:NADH:ubiquinone oxidoreductase subunit F (NADH-binding)/NADH:ubiquinone oxidoreductase subunit E